VTGTRYEIGGLFYFDKSVNHSINLKLDREQCPSSGLVNFAIPVRISLQTKACVWKEYFRAINRSMTVLPKTATIPKDSRAPPHYYGRGFHLDETDGTFVVCMNQHVPTAIPACYSYDKNSGFFKVVDVIIGCYLGKSSADGKIYGLARNQIAVYALDTTQDKWILHQDSALPAENTFKTNNLESTVSIGPLEVPSADHEAEHASMKWQGTGDGLYLKDGVNAWAKKADWFVNTNSIN